MRIPHRKIYRAFPELDVLTDRECVLYLRMIRRRRPVSRWIPYILGLIVSFVLFAVVTRFIGRVGARASAVPLSHLETIEYAGISLVDVFLTVIWTMSVIGVPILVTLLSRDLQLRWALAKKLGFVRCHACDHSLIGLPLLEGQDEPCVRCPECGRVVILARYGLKPEDHHPSAERTAAQKARIAE